MKTWTKKYVHVRSKSGVDSTMEFIVERFENDIFSAILRHYPRGWERLSTPTKYNITEIRQIINKSYIIISEFDSLDGFLAENFGDLL